MAKESRARSPPRSRSPPSPRRTPVRRKVVSNECNEDDDGIVLTVPSCGAVTLMCLGLILCWTMVHVSKLRGYDIAVQAVDQWTQQKNFLEEVMLAVIALAVCVFITGFIGWLGSSQMVKGLVCAYIVLCSLLAGVAFCLFFYMTWLQSEVSPMILGRGEDLCNATMHAVYSVMLDCHFHLEKSADFLRASCDEACQIRVAELRNMSGCGLLNVFCHNFAYTNMGRGECTTCRDEDFAIAAGSRPPACTGKEVPFLRSLTENPSRECCQEACDSAILCRGYVYDGHANTCKLLSPTLPWVDSAETDLEQRSMDDAVREATMEAPQNHEAKWTASNKAKNHTLCSHYTWDVPPNLDTERSEELAEVARIYGATGDKSTHAHCLRKDDDTGTIEALAIASRLMMLCTGVVGVALMLSGMCACGLQYFLVRKKEHEKGSPAAIIKSMLCPFEWCEAEGKSDFLLDCGDSSRNRSRKSRRQADSSDSDDPESSDDPRPSRRDGSPHNSGVVLPIRSIQRGRSKVRFDT